MSGWICLHRKLMDHWLFDDAEALKVWITMLMEANHAEKKKMFAGDLITIERGQMLTGRVSLSSKTGVSERRVRRVLDLLEKDGMIVRQKSNKYSLITITNYARYQDRVQQESSKRPQSDPHLNNVNNDNNRARRFSPPAVDDVRAYCEERGNGIDPQAFMDHYEANGWVQGKGKPVKDWKACVRTWENSRKQSRPADQPEAFV